MNFWFGLVLSILAVYRISYLIAKEDGPFDMFMVIREKADPLNPPLDWIGRGLRCILCVSFWLSLIPAILLFQGMGFWDFMVGWFGIAGGVLVLYKVIDEQLT